MLETITTVAATGGIPTLTNTTTTTTTTPSANVEVSSFDHVRLPGFWHNSPTQWFTHADAMFANKRIRSDLSRVNHVLETLDEDGVRTIADLLGSDAKYEAIRQQLIAAYSVPQATRFQRMIQPGGMGDRAPSRLLRLLRDMRVIYPADMTDSSLLAFWLSKLPPPVRTVITGLTGSVDFLDFVDRVWESSRLCSVSSLVPLVPGTGDSFADKSQDTPRSSFVRFAGRKRRRCSINTSLHDSNTDSSSTTTVPVVDFYCSCDIMSVFSTHFNN